MITFRANYISTEQIKTRTPENTYVASTASFVELDPQDNNDVKAIRKAINNWEGDTFGSNLYDLMTEFSSDEKFFALTTQEDKFEKLNPTEILGLASIDYVRADNDIRIDYLQTDPMYIDQGTYKKLPFYKRIGSALVDGIAKKYKDKSLSVFALESSKPFYEKTGFEKTGIAGILRRKPIVR